MRRAGLLLTVVAGLAASTLMAQTGDPNVGQVIYTHEPLPVATQAARIAQPASNALTASQQKAIAQGKALRPGVYRLRSVHSGGCVTSHWGTPRFLFQLSSCGTELIGNTWYGDDGLNHAILPHPAGGYTVRSAHPTILGWPQQGLRAPVRGEYGNCLTVARGVILGAPRIELLPCDSAGDWNRTGVDDQRFFFLTAGPGTYQIALALTGDGSDCWALRNGSRDSQTEVIRWQCNRTADQMWEPRWIAPVGDGYENGLLEQSGWYRTPSGHFNILGADGLDLTGPVYNSFDTANDGGDYCRKRCAELDQCKAWTWTGPGYVVNSNDPPRCYWKSAPGEPINRGPQTFGKLRSGIVRP